MQPDEALSLLKQGSAQIISEAELRQKLALGRPLRVKLGVDPTTPDLHLGHALILRKLRQFQDLGHQAVLIIGDFTSMIGDPSGRSATRPQLSREQVLVNAETYREQAFKVLDPARTRIVSNGEWFEPMPFEQVIRLNSFVTLQQMLQREDFRDRLDRQQPIHAHEIQYPIMQGWDSVMVQADVELGGTDQLFNILVGRDLQKQEGQPQQVVFVLPILEGLDGSQKMSKSLGNYVGLSESASEIFGKLMSISDQLMARYYPLLLGQPLDSTAHPLEAKKHLASAIVKTYHSHAAAEKTLEEWNARFSEKRLEAAELPYLRPSNYTSFVDVVGHAFQEAFRIKKSRSDVRRLIEQGSVQLDGKKITDVNATPSLRGGQVLRLDKTHAVRIQD
ncbi:MAG TPA: tyrosine--tRNA ligase [Chthoniobacterales bacterium]|nr:tyrosine--tRNA ligase [Chthoniobacterales bacterium]